MKSFSVRVAIPGALLAATMFFLCGRAPAQVVYANGFDDGAGPAWTNRLVDTSPSGRKFLGRFTKETIGLTLRDLPAHGAIRVSFDLFVIGPWDGRYAGSGLDVFDLRVRGGLVLAHTTFSNDTIQQNHPDASPGRLFAARTGAVENNTLGYPAPGDSVYRMDITFPHDEAGIHLMFSALNLDFRESENWGVDNVTVTALPSLGTERVTDGSFEQPDIPAEYVLLESPATIGAWTVAAGSVDLTGGYWETPDGKQSVDLTGTSRGTLRQEIQTTPGQPYVVRFAVSGHPLGPPEETPDVKQMSVYWAGQAVAPVYFDIAGRTTYDMGWRYHQYEVTGPAGAASAALEFRSTIDGFYGPVIDMVSVVPGSIAPLDGDVSGDGRVDITDALAASRAMAGLEPLGEYQRSLADVAPWSGTGGRAHGDGVLDAEDIRLLLGLSGGLTT